LKQELDLTPILAELLAIEGTLLLFDKRAKLKRDPEDKTRVMLMATVNEKTEAIVSLSACWEFRDSFARGMKPFQFAAVLDKQAIYLSARNAWDALRKAVNALSN
jgi:hypothetical protein